MVKRVIVGGKCLIVYSLSYYGNAVGAVYRLLASVSEQWHRRCARTYVFEQYNTMGYEYALFTVSFLFPL